MSKVAVEVNGRSYSWPKNPVVGVCVDGSQPSVGETQPGYIEEAIKAGVAPFFERMFAEGTSRIADCVVPSFTNPNNISIVTGRPPAVHGICGNFFYDQATDTEIMMNDPDLLRTDTIFKAFEQQGAKVCVITAKDKLRRLLGKGLSFGEGSAIGFSAERANEVTLSEHGIENVLELVDMPLPDVYSAELSEFIFAAGVKIMQRDRPDIMYLSTTDYIQHKHAPGTPVANAFYQMMDGYLAQLDAMGCTIVVTADHGMNAKHDDDEQPDVIYLQTLLDDWLGAGNTRVILPITDPYVVHHGALGSYATVYLGKDIDRQALIEKLAGYDGVLMALDRKTGCEKFELPEDRVGDIIIISEQQKALGTSPDRHDLSGLTEPLRSHGGVTEQKVPLLMNCRSDVPEDRALRNFDLYDVALNHSI